MHRFDNITTGAGRDVQDPNGSPLVVYFSDYALKRRLEIRSGLGELFGFERAGAISMQPAAAIVDAAVRFGQSDDITVVTIERLPTSQASDPLRNAPMAAPA